VERPDKARMACERAMHMHMSLRAYVHARSIIFFRPRIITARSVTVAEKVVSSVNTQLIGERGSKRMTQAETRRQHGTHVKSRDLARVMNEANEAKEAIRAKFVTLEASRAIKTSEKGDTF